MAEYRQSADAVFDLKYHMIRCAKYRKKILHGRIAERARDRIRQICAAHPLAAVGAADPQEMSMSELQSGFMAQYRNHSDCAAS